MKINFVYHEDLPTSYTPGSVYFIENVYINQLRELL